MCVCVCVSGHTCATVSLQRSEDTQESVLYFHLSGGFEDHIQVVMLCSKHLCPLNCLSSAVLFSLKVEVIQGYLEDAQGGETEVQDRCNHSGVELDGGLGCRWAPQEFVVC